MYPGGNAILRNKNYYLSYSQNKAIKRNIPAMQAKSNKNYHEVTVK